MNHHYTDIRDRIPEPPLWWDENAVPRYVPFQPRECANIYAQEVVLLRIACQGCGHEFEVCLSNDVLARHRGVSFAERIRDASIGYSDPPNIGCCASGPTMNSLPRQVLQYWRLALVPAHVWTRDPALEIAVRASWESA